MIAPLALVGVQTVLAFAVDGDGPVRFGFPVPVAALERGLRLAGDATATMQWSLLQTTPGLDDAHLWIEIAIVGQQGPARIELGGNGPSGEQGPVVSTQQSLERTLEAEVTRIERRWSDGTVDRIERRLALVDTVSGPAGDARYVADPAARARTTRVRIPAREWRRVGVLPPADRSGAEWRRELREAFARLPRAPGPRGQGDFVRGPHGEVVTNLEFDTTLGLIRLALCDDDPALANAAWAAARHLVDIDLDLRSGLPHRHGRDHDTSPPEPGHVWTEGLLLVGLTFADRELCATALAIARAVADRVRGGERPEGRDDRLRDEAWPLHQLECMLRFADLEPLRSAADALAARICTRFAWDTDVFDYGEARTRAADVVRDRLWLTCGIALPALRLTHARTGDARCADIVGRLERRAAAVLLRGGRGIPLQVVVGPSGPFDAVHVEGCAEGFLLLDGLPDALRRRALARSGIRAGLVGALDPAADDLATRFSIVARCAWVLR